jgi:hypothetical protein
MIKGEIVVYKLAPADESEEEASQLSQASSVLQSSQGGWRFKGSRARIKEVGEEAGDETQYCIEIIVSERVPSVAIFGNGSAFCFCARDQNFSISISI